MGKTPCNTPTLFFEKIDMFDVPIAREKKVEPRDLIIQLIIQKTYQKFKNKWEICENDKTIH